jgi:NDP-sugar pyrophosphorylase family protein
MKLIILAAGKGKRFLPITNTIPKGMVPILGEPLLKHVVEPYLPHVSDIVFVVSKGLGIKIKDYFKKSYQGHKVSYKIQAEQLGTMDALMTCKDLIKEGELFCVCYGDDLLKESDIERAIKEGGIGSGISKKIMPKNYLGVQVDNKYISGFVRHDEKKNNIEDVFYNGFNILDSRVFEFHPIATRDGELGLPHTLFANLDTYPLKAFVFESWETVNGPKDVPGAQKFLKKSN